MEKYIKTVKVKLRLNATQEKHLTYQASLVRFAYNWALGRRNEVFQETGKTLNYHQQSAEFTAFKKENLWLYDGVASALQRSLRDLDTAFKNFFDGRAKLPKFKSKNKTLPKIRYPEGCKLEGNRLRLPKIGWIRCFNSHNHGEVKTVTVKKTARGDWFAYCVTEFTASPVKQLRQVCGVDLGLKDLAVIFNGADFEHVEAPKFFRKYEKQLGKAQTKLNRKKFGSKNRAKAKLEVAKLNRRIADLRANFLHQLTNRLSNEYDLICLEDLSLKGMAKTRLAKSVLDAALGEFVRQIEYKTLWRGGTTQKIDRFFPSSKLHGACGAVNKDLKLSDRTWLCECGEIVIRDENAAYNILLEGLTGYDIPSLKLWRKDKSSDKLAPSNETGISFA